MPKPILFSIILGILFIPSLSLAATFTVAEYKATAAGAVCLINPITENSKQGRGCAQSFIGKTGSITAVEFTMRKTGAPTGQITFSIRGDDTGKPSTVSLVSSTISSASLSDTYAPVSVNLSLAMASGTIYWLAITSDDAVSNSNYTEIQPSAGLYNDGVGNIFTGGSWQTSTPEDMIFKITGDDSVSTSTSTSTDPLILLYWYLDYFIEAIFLLAGSGLVVWFLYRK
jgi:hypothetical protein